MNEQLERVRTKLTAAGKRLNETLTVAAVTAFEKQHGIALPEEYRAFLLEVGNGGDGPPLYGVPRLGDVPNYWPAEAKETFGHFRRIGESFPFTSAWVWEDGEQSLEGSEQQVGAGSVYVGTDGCGMNWHLIVTGEDRGCLWQFCGEAIQPTVPKRTFLRWYEDWLDGVSSWWETSPDAERR